MFVVDMGERKGLSRFKLLSVEWRFRYVGF